MAPAEAVAGGGTLDRLTGDYRARVAAALGSRPLARLDLAFVLRTEGGVSADLSALAGRLIAAQLRRMGFRSVQQLAAAGAGSSLRQLGRSGFELLLDSTLSVQRPLLHLRGELRDLGRNFWQALVQPLRESLAHVHASVRIDAEISAVQRGRRSKRSRFLQTRHAAPSCPVVALVAVPRPDARGDDLVALHPRQLTISSFSGAAPGFVVQRRLDLPGPAAPVASRRVVGSLAVLPGAASPRAVLLRTSAAANAARLSPTTGDATLQISSNQAGYALGTLTTTAGQVTQLRGVLTGGTDRFVTAMLTLDGGRLTSEQLSLLPAAFYRLKVALAPGAAESQLVALVGVDGRLVVVDSRLTREVLSRQTVGVAFELADLDDDGNWELVSSSGGPPDGPDEIAIHRLTSKGQLALVSRHRELGGVVAALTHGDFNGDGRTEIVAAIQQHGEACALVRLD